LTRSEQASNLGCPELSAHTLTVTQSSRSIAFTSATKFRETLGLGFTLCSLARVSRRDRGHLGLPPILPSTREPHSRFSLLQLGDEWRRKRSVDNFSQRIRDALAA